MQWTIIAVVIVIVLFLVFAVRRWWYYTMGDDDESVPCIKDDSLIVPTTFLPVVVRYQDFSYRHLEKGQSSSAYYHDDGAVMENTFIRAYFSCRGGRLARMDWLTNDSTLTGDKVALYQCPQAHNRGVNCNQFFLAEGATVLGGNFLVFPGAEHGAYSNTLVPICISGTDDMAQVEFILQDSSMAVRSQRYNNYFPTYGTFTVTNTMLRTSDVLCTHVNAMYPMDNSMTALWYCTTPTVGQNFSQITSNTNDARWVTKASVTCMYAHDTVSCLKDIPSTAAFQVVEYPYQCKDACVAYIRSNWLALVDNGQAFVIYTVDDMNMKVCSWGKPGSYHYDYSNDNQPYVEACVSPLNKTCEPSDGVAITAGTTIHFNVFQFILNNVRSDAPDDVRTKVDAYIEKIKKSSWA